MSPSKPEYGRVKGVRRSNGDIGWLPTRLEHEHGAELRPHGRDSRDDISEFSAALELEQSAPSFASR